MGYFKMDDIFDIEIRVEDGLPILRKKELNHLSVAYFIKDEVEMRTQKRRKEITVSMHRLYRLFSVVFVLGIGFGAIVSVYYLLVDPSFLKVLAKILAFVLFIGVSLILIGLNVFPLFVWIWGGKSFLKRKIHYRFEVVVVGNTVCLLLALVSMGMFYQAGLFRSDILYLASYIKF